MFYTILNKLKLNLIRKKKNIKLKLNKSDLLIINIFLKLNIIKYIKKINNQSQFIITLNLNSKSFHFYQNIYKTSQLKIISLKELKKITLKKK